MAYVTNTSTVETLGAAAVACSAAYGLPGVDVQPVLAASADMYAAVALDSGDIRYFFDCV